MLFARYKVNNIHRDNNERDFFKFMELIPEKGEILDIGANIGIMTVHLSKKFPNSNVHAFEPEPHNVKILRKIIKRYQLQNVKVYPIALGDETGELEMILPEKGSVKMQGLSHVVHDDIKEWNKGEKFTVKSECLDNMQLGEVSAIKIDVENFEYFVLKGGKEMLKNNKPIIYAELWNNENRTQTMDFLKDLGYTTYFVNERFELEKLDNNFNGKQNFIFVKED